MVLDARKTEKNLCKKGFKIANGNHRFLVFYDGNKKTTIHTMMSHNGQDIDKFLISKMAEQVHLSKDDFISFANCTLTESQYRSILMQQKLL